MKTESYDEIIAVKKDAGKYCRPNCVSEKEILSLAWNYFQQHAQQRLSFFNFFAVFAVLMTTGLITTFQEKFKAHSVGIAVGLMLSLISYVFFKIDERNKYLTKNGENAIKQIEKYYTCADCYPEEAAFQLFSAEQGNTEELRKNDLKRNILFRQISHSKSFNIIFITFFVVGIFGAGASAYFQFTEAQNKSETSEANKKVDELIASNIKLNQLVLEILKDNRETNLKEAKGQKRGLPLKAEKQKVPSQPRP